MSKFEGAAGSLKVNIAFDCLTPDFRRRITVALLSVIESAKVLLAALNSRATIDRTDAGPKEEQDETE